MVHSREQGPSAIVTTDRKVHTCCNLPAHELIKLPAAHKGCRFVCGFWKQCSQAGVPDFVRDVAVQIYLSQVLTSFIPDELHLVLCGRIVLKFVDAQDLVAGLSKSVKPYSDSQWASKEWGLLNRLKWNVRQFCSIVCPPRTGELALSEEVETVATLCNKADKLSRADKRASVTAERTVATIFEQGVKE
jgi:hypothetical protein